MEFLQILIMKYSGIGYVQGMNFLCDSILHHCDPEIGLIITSYLFEDNELCDLYRDGLVGLHTHNKIVKNLIALKMPDLYNHLVEEYDVRIDVCSDWVLNLFSHLIPINLYVSFHWF